jgi:hypothetical protein
MLIGFVSLENDKKSAIAMRSDNRDGANLRLKPERIQVASDIQNSGSDQGQARHAGRLHRARQSRVVSV